MGIYISISNREQKFLVDVDIYQLINKYKWNESNGYIYRTIYDKNKPPYFHAKLYLHRFIMNPPANVPIDHIDGDTYNNLRINLRLCTDRDNNRNKKKFFINYTEYKGVFWRKDRQTWIAKIKVDGKGIYLGSFNNERDAAKAYNDAAKEYFGKFANYNKIN